MIFFKQAAVYINDAFYMNIDFEDPTQPHAREIIKKVRAQRDAGMIADWPPGEERPIKVVPIKEEG